MSITKFHSKSYYKIPSVCDLPCSTWGRKKTWKISRHLSHGKRRRWCFRAAKLLPHRHRAYRNGSAAAIILAKPIKRTDRTRRREKWTGLGSRKRGEPRNAGNWISSLSGQSDSRVRDIMPRARAPLHFTSASPWTESADKSTDKTRV